MYIKGKCEVVPEYRYPSFCCNYYFIYLFIIYFIIYSS
jgi:hypothetical protein